MPILPWDDWMYNLPAKRDEVNNLHQKAVDLQHDIDGEMAAFNKDLDAYKGLIAGNSALLVISNTISMDDAHYSDFSVKVEAIETPAAGSLPLSVASVLTELSSGALIVKALIKLGKFTYGSLTSPTVAASESEATSEAAVKDLAEAGEEAGLEATGEAGAEITSETVGEGVTEAAAEAVIEGATLTGLGALGIGIFAAVGIDAVFGAINGAKENTEIESQIAALTTAVNKCSKYLNALTGKHQTITKGIVAEEIRFVKLINVISGVAKKNPTFDLSFDPTIKNAPQFTTAMTKALTQYSVYVEMRDVWGKARKRNPQLTRDQFIQDFITFAPEGVTQADLVGYWNALALYSDQMNIQARSAG